MGVALTGAGAAGGVKLAGVNEPLPRFGFIPPEISGPVFGLPFVELIVPPGVTGPLFCVVLGGGHALGFAPELLWQPPARAKLVTTAPASASTGFLPISILSPVLDRCHRAAARARPGLPARARWAAVPEKRRGV